VKDPLEGVYSRPEFLFVSMVRKKKNGGSRDGPGNQTGGGRVGIFADINRSKKASRSECNLPRAPDPNKVKQRYAKFIGELIDQQKTPGGPCQYVHKGGKFNKSQEGRQETANVRKSHHVVLLGGD